MFEVNPPPPGATPPPEGVAEAVERARCVDMDAAGLKPVARLVYSEYLLLGGEAEAAATAMQRLVEAEPSRLEVADYTKTLGWALLASGKPAPAHEAFTRALGRYQGWIPEPPAQASPDHWIAAYFLDLVTAESFTSRWDGAVAYGVHYACFPWFFVGQRMEIEKRIEEAKAAYHTCLERAARATPAHHAAHWAAYRLKVLSEAAAAASASPALPPTGRP